MSDIAEQIIEAILPHISCRHSETSDGSGRRYVDVEYDVDEKGKEKIGQILSQEK